MLLEAVSFSHDKATAYMPVVDLLGQYFDIEAEDDGRKRREKVAGKIAILDRALEDTLPYLYGLFGLVEGDDPLAGMDAPIRRQRTLEALKRILLRESLNQPLVVIFEDLHWIDDETQAFFHLGSKLPFSALCDRPKLPSASFSNLVRAHPSQSASAALARKLSPLTRHDLFSPLRCSVVRHIARKTVLGASS